MKDAMTHPVLVNHAGDTMFLPNLPIHPMTMRHPSGKISRVLVQVIDAHTDPHLGAREMYSERRKGKLVIRRLNNIFIPQIPA